MKQQFANVGMFPENPKYEQGIRRQRELYQQPGDPRSPFYRDYTRILHCNAYRRLKHKTQVFYATGNDHTCTRIEHVHHVAAISYTLASAMGLNPELAQTIALGHDLGHAPFGHHGEAVLRRLVRRELGTGEDFWHEKNSLRFVDHIETLPDLQGNEQNLNLTYAVRDGIICHCGEVTEEALVPRDAALDLETLQYANQYAPWSWEGCIMKVADKIAFLGRDLEDSVALGILTESHRRTLARMLSHSLGGELDLANLPNTLLINSFVEDLLANSSPRRGVRFSSKMLKLIRELSTFSFYNIYDHVRLKPFAAYASLLLDQLFNHLSRNYKGVDTIRHLESESQIYPTLHGGFSGFLRKYSTLQQMLVADHSYGHSVLYDLTLERDYKQAIVDYISGMTDHFALKCFQEILYIH